MMLPALVANLVSMHTYQAQVFYHYTVYPLVGVVVAALIGAAVATNWSDRPRRTAIAVSIVAALAFLPLSGVFAEWNGPLADHEQYQQALALVPPDATVAAWYRFVPPSHPSDDRLSAAQPVGAIELRSPRPPAPRSGERRVGGDSERRRCCPRFTAPGVGRIRRCV